MVLKVGSLSFFRMKFRNNWLRLLGLRVLLIACSEKFCVGFIHVLRARMVGLVNLAFLVVRVEHSSQDFQFRLLFVFLAVEAVAASYQSCSRLVGALPLLLNVAVDCLFTAVQSLDLEHLKGKLRLTLKPHMLGLLHWSVQLLLPRHHLT